MRNGQWCMAHVDFPLPEDAMRARDGSAVGIYVARRYEHPNDSDLDEWRELMTRWFQFGTFCPLLRVHGQFPYREMFNVAPEDHPAYQTMLAYDKLRYRLMPYIYSLTGMVTQNDYTVMRAQEGRIGSKVLQG